MKTREQVERLKRDWADDACWDIEDTEGFEDYKTELLEYRSAREADWQERLRKQKEEKAMRLGITRMELVDYLEQLEYRIKALEEIQDK